MNVEEDDKVFTALTRFATLKQFPEKKLAKLLKNTHTAEYTCCMCIGRALECMHIQFKVQRGRRRYSMKIFDI